MRSKFDELLPFYVNGSLPEADRAWIDQYLGKHPSAAAELRWYQSLQTKLREDVPAVSSEIGMERALQRIRTEGPVPQLTRRAAAPTWFERVGEFFRSITPQPMLRPAFIGALAVVALQGAVIVELMFDRGGESSYVRAIAPKVTDKGPYLKLNFKPDAKEADIRILLVEVQGSLAAGPGQLGDYYVRVPANKESTIAAKLKASTIVDAVAVVDALPAQQ